MASELLAGEKTAKAAGEPGRRAYVTLLAGDQEGASFEAVVRLAESLREVGAAYPLVVAVLPGVPQSRRGALVSQYGCVVREILPVYGNEAKFATMPPHDVLNCSKLRVSWEFVEYERMVYLDAGIQVVKNIDELFELQKGHFYAAELRPPPAQHVNSGMFVHEPGVATAEAPPTSVPEMPDQYKPIPLDHNLVQAITENLQLDKSVRPWGESLPQFGRWLTAKAAAFAQQNPAAMATLAASSSAVGVITSAANPAICYGFYTLFIAAIATIAISLRGI